MTLIERCEIEKFNAVSIRKWQRIRVRLAMMSVPGFDWNSRAKLKQEGYDLMGAAFEFDSDPGYGIAEDI